jgi:hypothetical protein
MNVENEQELAKRFFMEHSQPALQLDPIPSSYYKQVHKMRAKQPGVYREFKGLVFSLSNDLMAAARKGELTSEQLAAVTIRPFYPW